MDIVKRLLVQGGLMAVGAGLLWLANNVFDWIIYPMVMCSYGNVSGGVIMALASVPFNYFLICGYDKIGKDLLGIETLKEFQVNEANDGTLKRFLGKLLKHSRFGTFVFMSLYDPIPATLYMRQGSRTYNGLVGTDWIWFTISNIIANATWIVLIGLGVEVADAITGVCT